MMRKSIEIVNKLDEIDKIAAFIETVGEELQLTPSATMEINLALEEAIVNVILYAYPKGEDFHHIQLSVENTGNQLTFVLTDSGVAFDPTKIPEADTSLPIEERPIGGLGILLVRKIMTSVTYQRI